MKQVVTQKLGLVEQEVNQIGTQKPLVALRDLQEEDIETSSSFKAMCILYFVYNNFSAKYIKMPIYRTTVEFDVDLVSTIIWRDKN